MFYPSYNKNTLLNRNTKHDKIRRQLNTCNLDLDLGLGLMNN